MDEMICGCQQITRGMIERAVINGANSLEKVKEVTGACSGCGECQEIMRRLVDNILKSIEGDRA